MAEITKVTTPMIPKENTSNKMKPVTDQAFDLTDPSKVHKAEQEGRSAERQSDGTNLLKDSVGRPVIVPLLKNSGDMMQTLKKIALIMEMGVSASDAAKDVSAKELLESLFVSQKDFAKVLLEQDKSSVLFKGEAFDILRDIQDKFAGTPKVRDAIANLLKIFDYNVNSQNSIKNILYSGNSILDYMFSKDKMQFSNYLKDLAEMLLPKPEAKAFIENKPVSQSPAQAQGQGQVQNQQQAQGQTQATGHQPAQTQGEAQATGQQPAQAQGQAQATGQQPAQAQGQTQAAGQQPAQAQGEAQATGQQPAQAQGQTQAAGQQPAQAQGQTQATGQQPAQAQGQDYYPQQAQNNVRQTAPDNAYPSRELPPMTPKEAAGILKNNLLPLLGEIVVKYYQNEKIRDTVMVVVHNIVRVDQGTPEALDDAVAKLARELREVANMPPGFERQLQEAIKSNVEQARTAPNSVVSKLSEVVSQALTSPNTTPAMARQAENMLISMLQNQSTIMDVLHFVMPFQTPMGQVFTELYVDPETNEKVGKQKGKSHKIFLSVESEAHGSFELSFLETAEHVDFAMWCPESLVGSLSTMKKNIANIMQLHGYTMNSFNVAEMKAPHSVAEVFPRLLEKKVGIDVQI